jgi:cobyrinic acid a,c-diamide synthase
MSTVAKGLVIGAPRSGAGKTSVAIGLMRALAERGLSVRGAKSGPDYIDPGFHAAATGRDGVNLDSWAMRPDLLRHLAARATSDAGMVIAESAMGLFDGIPAEPGRTGAGSDLARLFGLPVLLVLDVSGQSTTAAAVAKGFATYDPDVRIGGVVLNRVGSERHRRLCTEAIEAVGLKVVGSIARDPRLSMPERHLGLVQAGEHEALESFIAGLAAVMAESIDLDAVIALAAPFAPSAGGSAAQIDPPGQRVALAADRAFTFVYPHLAAHWCAMGAEIVPFSPLADEAPAAGCDICWLPGGYPELHAGTLAAAEKFRSGLKHFAQTHLVHGECGGFMVLGEALEDADGVTHRMTGLLSHATSFAKRKMNLGYRRATLLNDTPIGRSGLTIRGHEFHYASVTDAGSDAPFASLEDGRGASLGPSGARRGHVSGTFFHAIARE